MANKITIVNDFTNKIKEIKKDDVEIINILDIFLNLEDSEKTTLLENFYKKFLLVSEGNDLLQKKKNKLFSSKEEETYNFSISLFGEQLSLKKIFNNLDENKDREYLWICLKLLINYLKPDDEKVENSLLKIKVDKNTNEMIQDIVDVFKDKFKEGGESNPLQSIMEVTGLITEKYHEKIQNGDIKLESIMSEFEEKIPGVKEMLKGMIPKNKVPMKKVVMHDNFSTANVVTGEDKPDENNMDLSSMLKLMNQVSGGAGGAGGAGGLADILGMLGSNSDTLKNKDEMNKLMQDKFNINMDNIMKNFNK